MQLILAIDSDPRRSEQLRTLVKARLTVDLVQASSAGEGLHALKDRVPDLILTAPLLSPFDDGVLDEYLRDLGAAATHVQTVRIPMLSAAPKKSTATRLFGLGRKKPTSSATPDGCDPKVFADEVSHYLTRSLEERAASTKATADKSAIGRAAASQVPAQALSSEYATFVDAEPQALIEEFGAPIADEPAPIQTSVVADVHVPGAILDLRPTPVEVRKSQFIVEPKPQTFIAPEPQTFILPEAQTFIEPEPPFDFAQDTQAFVEPDLEEFVEPIAEPLVEPEVPAVAGSFAAGALPEPVSAPATPAAPTGTSPSFEAALAAIRAAWATPEEKKPETAPVAAAAEVDLTRDVDALEDIDGPGARRSPARRRLGDDRVSA